MTATVIYLMASLIVATLAQGTPPGPHVIAASSDWSITSEEFEEIVKTFPDEGRQRFSVPANRRSLVNELVRIWVVSTEARKKGVGIGTDYQSRRNYYADYAREIGSKIGEEAVRKYYNANLDDFTEVALSHILILNGNSPVTPFADVKRLPYEEAEKKAHEIKAMLDKGADWDTLCKEYSQDINTAANGGAVGYFPKGRAEKSIDTTAFSLKVGEISDVVGSIFGFHILRVTDRKVTPFEEVQDQIHQKLAAEEVNRQLDAKVKEAGVTTDESFFR